MNTDIITTSIKKYIIYILLVIMGVILGVAFKNGSNNVVPGDTLNTTPTTIRDTNDTSKITSKGTITITPAPSTATGDTLVVKEALVATNGNRRVEVPIRNQSVPLNNSESKDTLNKNIEVTNTIDVSSLVRPLVPKWEIGIGVGTHDGDTYIPVSIQRDYKVDKAVRLEIHLDPTAKGDTKKILSPKGIEVQHVWKF